MKAFKKDIKIAAFTMVDVLTGMVITSIIIAMVFYLFTGLNKQVYDYGNVRNELNSYLLLRTDLKRQFDKGDQQIVGIPRGFEIKTKTDLITYAKVNETFMRETKFSVDTLTNGIGTLDIEFLRDKDEELTDHVKNLHLGIFIKDIELKTHFYSEASLVDEINQKLLHEF